jgi:formiminotetrahydrofolate cyclodeaminase
MTDAPVAGSADQATADLRATTLGDYLDRVASAAPAPGGGSVAGVVAALAAGLGAMACRLSGERDAAGERRLTPALADALTRLERARAEATRLAAADERAYAAYRAAASLPRADDRQRAARRQAMQAALVGATETPLALAAACRDILEALRPVVRDGNPHVRSDADLAVSLAAAAAAGALRNVRDNAASLRDAARTATFRAEADALARAIASARAAVEAGD